MEWEVRKMRHNLLFIKQDGSTTKHDATTTNADA